MTTIVPFGKSHSLTQKERARTSTRSMMTHVIEANLFCTVLYGDVINSVTIITDEKVEQYTKPGKDSKSVNSRSFRTAQMTCPYFRRKKSRIAKVP